MNDLETAVPTSPELQFATSWFVDHRGYSDDPREEFQALREAGTVVVTRQDRDRLSVVALLSSEATSAALLDAEAAARLVAEALESRGQLATLRVVQVGRHAVSAATVDRLFSAGTVRANAGNAVAVWLVDPTNGFNYANEHRPPREFTLLSQSMGRGLKSAGARGIPAPMGPAYFSYALLFIIAAVYVAELYVVPGGSLLGGPVPGSFLPLGGTSSHVLKLGELWRLTTAPLLHATFTHVLLNGIALLLIGPLLERWIGTRWIASIFVVSAVVGSFASAIFHDPRIVGVGASGGLFGLFAASMIVALRLPPGRDRGALLRRAASIFALGVLQLFQGGSEALAVDYVAHIGGAIAGTLACLALLWLYSRDQAARSLHVVTMALPIAFFAVAAAGTLPISGWLADSRLVAPAWPQTETAWRRDVAPMAREYPRDPRLKYLLAGLAAEAGQTDRALSLVEDALQEERLLRFYMPELRQGLVIAKAAFVLAKGRREEAFEIARSACVEATSPDLRQMLAVSKLCQ